jgi:hypothetical protein
MRIRVVALVVAVGTESAFQSGHLFGRCSSSLFTSNASDAVTATKRVA